MNLLDFKYWISLNESQKSYYTFEIPKRRLTELDEAYLTGLKDLLSDLPESAYELNYSNGSITLTLHPKQDDLISSIYGEAKDITIYLTSPGESNYYSGNFANVSTSKIVTGLTKSHFSSTVKDKSDVTSVIFAISPSNLDDLINASTNRIVGITSHADYLKLDSSSFLHLIYDQSDNTEKKIKDFSEVLNKYLRYFAVESVLRKFITSESTPNLEELGASIKTRLEKIKSIELEKLSPEEKESFVTDVLSFQRDLLDKASKGSIESKILTDALIENFRILLKEFGNSKEIKKALSKITT